MYRIGIDIGGTKIKIGLFDYEKRELKESDKQYIKDIGDISLYIESTVKRLCDKNKIDLSDVEFIGIGIPGTVSEDGKRILKAPNIAKLPCNIADEIEARLGLQTKLVQDSRAAAYGEFTVSEKKHSVTVCVTLGTGIGTGIVIDGKIFSGALSSAGELGHLPMKENGRVCGCGKRGCLEKYSAGGGLDITAAELLGEGKSSADLFFAAERGNKEALSAISEAVTMLGRGLVSIVNLLSPGCIVFSGGLSAQRKLYLAPLIDYISMHCYSASGALPEMTVAALGEDSPLFGAAFLPVE